MRSVWLIGRKEQCELVWGAFSTADLMTDIRLAGMHIIDCSIEEGSREDIPGEIRMLLENPDVFFVQIGKKIYEISEEKMISLVHPTVIVSDNFFLGVSSIIMPACLFYPNFKAGKYNVFLNGVKTGHDVVIGESCFFDYFSFIGSHCSFGNNIIVGAKATIKEYVGISDDVIVMEGSVLVNDIPVGETWRGIPAKKI